MKRVIRIKESELREMIYESVKEMMKENTWDDIKTNFAYTKNVIRDYFPPIGVYDAKSDIRHIKFNIKCMEEHIQNNKKCGDRFLYQYENCMISAKENGYIKYYKIMKQLYDQMIELGLYTHESSINPISINDIYDDLKNRIKKRGGHFHG